MKLKYSVLFLIIIIILIGVGYFFEGKITNDESTTSNNCDWEYATEKNEIVDFLWNENNSLNVLLNNKIIKANPLRKEVENTALSVKYKPSFLVKGGTKYITVNDCKNQVALVESENVNVLLSSDAKSKYFLTYLQGLSVSPQGSYLSVDTQDNEMFIYDLTNNELKGKILGRYSDQLDPIFGAYTYDYSEKYIVEISGAPFLHAINDLPNDDYKALIVDIFRNELRGADLKDVAISSDQRFLALNASAAFTGAIPTGLRVYDLTKDELYMEKLDTPIYMELLGFSPNNKLLLANLKDGIHIINLESRQDSFLSQATLAKFSSDSKYVALVNNDKLTVFDAHTTQIIYIFNLTDLK